MKTKFQFNFLAALAIVFAIISLWALTILINNKISPHCSFYISITGKDSNTGSKNYPFKTLEGCQKSIRIIVKGDKLDKGTITIYLKEGTYYLNKAFILDKNDFINNNVLVTYKPYKKDKGTITGAVELESSKFNKVTDEALMSSFINKGASKDILQYDLKEAGIYLDNTLEDITKATELFVNDKPMILSRWPNDEFLTIDKVIYNPQQDEKKDLFLKIRIIILVYGRTLRIYGFWLLVL